MHLHWASAVSIASPIFVGILAYFGSQRGIRRQIRAAQAATQRGEQAEHARWLRDRAVETYVAAIDLVEELYHYRRQLYGLQIAREEGDEESSEGRAVPSDPASAITQRQVAARLQLFGSRHLRQLLEAAIEAHYSAVYNLKLIMGEPFAAHDGPRPSIAEVHEFLDVSIRADNELQEGLTDAVQEGPWRQTGLVSAVREVLSAAHHEGYGDGSEA